MLALSISPLIKAISGTVSSWPRQVGESVRLHWGRVHGLRQRCELFSATPGQVKVSARLHWGKVHGHCQRYDLFSTGPKYPSVFTGANSTAIVSEVTCTPGQSIRPPSLGQIPRPIVSEVTYAAPRQAAMARPLSAI